MSILWSERYGDKLRYICSSNRIIKDEKTIVKGRLIPAFIKIMLFLTLFVAILVKFSSADFVAY